MKSNQDLRDYAKQKGVRLYEVAAELEVWDSALSRRLRHELSPKDKQDFIKAVDRVARRKIHERGEKHVKKNTDSN